MALRPRQATHLGGQQAAIAWGRRRGSGLFKHFGTGSRWIPGATHSGGGPSPSVANRAGKQKPQGALRERVPTTSGRFCSVVVRPRSGIEVSRRHGGWRAGVCAEELSGGWAQLRNRVKETEKLKGLCSNAWRCVAWRLELMGCTVFPWQEPPLRCRSFCRQLQPLSLGAHPPRLWGRAAQLPFQGVCSWFLERFVLAVTLVPFAWPGTPCREPVVNVSGRGFACTQGPRAGSSQGRERQPLPRRPDHECGRAHCPEPLPGW